MSYYLALVSTGSYWATAFNLGRILSKPVLKRLFILLGISTHGWLLYRWIDGQNGQNLTTSHVISLIFWVVSILGLIYAAKTKSNILIRFVFLCAGLSILLQKWSVVPPHILMTGESPFTFFHILFAVLVVSIMILAGFQAFCFALLEWRLRRKQSISGGDPALSLLQMEKMLFQTLVIGFVLLSGLLVSSLLHFQAQLMLPVLLKKTIASVLAWLVFAVLLIGHYQQGWRGLSAIRWTWLGVLLLFSSSLMLS